MLGKEMTEKHKTRNFDKLDELTRYAVLHLYGLYDELDNASGSEVDYVQGSIDTTQHYLLKCGVEFMDYEEYLEKVALQWKPKQ
jgi:hypothetical protein